MKTRSLPSQKYLHECFSYNPKSGILRWKHRPRKHFATLGAYRNWNVKYSGRKCGCPDQEGYLLVGLGGRTYKVHRLIYKWMCGKNPPNLLDHKNHDPADNRWRKLRAVTLSQSNANTRVQKNNSTGYKGVTKFGDRYQVRIMKDGKRHFIGYFVTAKQAAKAYDKVARRLFGRYANLNF